MDESTTPDIWSESTHDIYEALTAHREAGGEAVVATVVDVRGSAYRRPGARMIVTDEPSLGAITAESLEGPLSASSSRWRAVRPSSESGSSDGPEPVLSYHEPSDGRTRPRTSAVWAFGFARTMYLFIGALGSVVTGTFADTVGWLGAYGAIAGLLVVSVSVLGVTKVVR